MRRQLTTALLATAFALIAAPTAQAQFGFAGVDVAFNAQGGAAELQAGSHPHETVTSFAINTELVPEGIVPAESIRELVVELPPGFVGDPGALPQCTSAEFAAVSNLRSSCPDSAAIGIAIVHGGFDPEPPGAGPLDQFAYGAVYNLTTTHGQAARIGFVALGVPTIVDITLSPDPPYRLLAHTRNINNNVFVQGTTVTVWGDPSADLHTPLRGECLNLTSPTPEPSSGGDCPSAAPERRAFTTAPRSCRGELSSLFAARSWADPLSWVSGTATRPGMGGCEALGFDPEVAAAPTTDLASSPSGFDFSIEISDPGLTDPDERAASDLKKAVVTLPEGMTVNPAAAGGLAACSEAQLAAESPDSAPGEGCPEAAKVATVEVTTPLLDEQLSGSIFLAEPYKNPLGTLLAGYLVIKQPERGIAIKLAGKIELDPGTGQITASFDQNPQLPFSELEVSFFSGAKGPLTTPSTCGAYQVRTELHPWSGNAADVSSQPFTIAQAPGGGPCPTSQAALPHAPGFDAGSVSPLAGRHSPFVVNLRRADGTQRFSTVRLTPPPGLVAKLAGTPACSDQALAVAAANSGRAEQAAPSCPAAARIGTVHAAAGSGPAPYWAPGTAYLAGPYKGAPLSMAILTPAVAGPFDLGVVVIRTALHVDPASAVITAVSDPIPEYLRGIPLDVRQALIRLDKPDFTLNGTSCEPSAVSGSLLSTLGALAALRSRFQLGECARLGFKPRMNLRLKGGTRRSAHPALTTVLRPRGGDANIKSLSVKLPRSAFIDQANIGTVCTRVQWAQDACPRASIYGTVIAHTPLLDHPLRGKVYLRSSDNPLPDLVPDLRGPAHQPIRVESAGRTDSVKGALRNRFSFIPDAPISRVVVRLFGGKRGLIVNSRSVCRGANRANVRFTAHNGKTHTARPKVRNPNCRKAKRRGHRRAQKRRGQKQSALALRSAVR